MGHTTRAGIEGSSERSARPGNRGRWLAIGAALAVVSNGHWIFWLATWLAPLFLVRYFRTATRPWRASLATVGLLTLAGAISWFGLMPFPPQVLVWIMLNSALVALFCLWVDRVTHRRRPGLLQTLVFPLTWASLEYIGFLRSETTWAAIGYTQASFLPLVQLAAVTGLTGITFFVMWFASWGNDVWEQWERNRRLRPAQLAYPIALALVLAGGLARLVLARPAAEPVVVASVSPPDLLDDISPEELQLLQRYFMKQPVDSARLAAAVGKLEADYQELFRITRREAARGADIVVWPEAALIAFGEERRVALLQEARQVAIDEGIFLSASVVFIPKDPRELNENKTLLIGPDGHQRGEYFKTQLVPHVEQPFTRPGDGTIGIAETSHGRIATLICFDLDNPRYVAQLAGRHVDLLLVPSGDWPAIKALHPAMARVRAVELGLPLVRPANHGLTQFVDPYGRVIAEMDHYATKDRTLRAAASLGSLDTPYARHGDVFAWACLASWLPVVLLSLVAFRRRRSVIAEARPVTVGI